MDFRQLIKDMADKFKIRIEMRQIGSRQEAQRLGGIGSCGRELCCSTWLTDFRSVSTSAARYQQLSLNPQKLAGQCGKLKCCLNYELDMYLEAIKSFPTTDVKIHTEKGTAFHIKTDVFKRQLWYMYEGEASIGVGLVALSPERVQEIIKLNKGGKKPADLKDFDSHVQVARKEPDYDNVVGQDSLNRFDNTFSKNKKRKKKKPNGQGQTAEVNANAKPAQKPQQGNKPQQNKPQNSNKPQQNKPQSSNKPQGNKPQQNTKPQQAKPQQEKPVENAAAGENPQAQANPNKKRNNRRRPPRKNNGGNEGTEK
ncbi:hypothetical protein D3C86_1430460 [compost metagenome]